MISAILRISIRYYVIRNMMTAGNLKPNNLTDAFCYERDKTTNKYIS